MKPKAKQSPEYLVREMKRRTRRKFNSEKKIRIILEGLRVEDRLYVQRRQDEQEIPCLGTLLRIPRLRLKVLIPIT